MEARFTTTDVEPWTYSYGMNIARRHLSTKQKAEFALAWKNHEKEAAKERQSEHGGTAPGRPKNTSGNVSGSVNGGDSRDKIGERVGVSGRAIDKISVVKEFAPEKLKDDSSLEETIGV